MHNDQGTVESDEESQAPRFEEIKTDIDCLVYNLERLKEEIELRDEVCPWCCWNALTCIGSVENWLEKYAPKEPEEAVA